VLSKYAQFYFITTIYYAVKKTIATNTSTVILNIKDFQFFMLMSFAHSDNPKLVLQRNEF